MRCITIKNYLKCIVVGFGGILPGLSGSVLLIIFDLYKDTIYALSTLNKNFKKNIKFLLPIVLGMISGVLLFSKLIDFLLNKFELPTRFTFLGLVLGTIPLFYKEVKKEGFSKKYYIYIILSIIIGLFLITNTNMNNQLNNLNILNSIILGIIVAASSIIPGIDTTVILSSCGLYKAYVNSLANFNLSVLLPMILGLILGALLISKIMNLLIKNYYTITFSIIFGLFISIIPSILPNDFSLGLNIQSIFSIILMILGFLVSYILGILKVNEENKESEINVKE